MPHVPLRVPDTTQARPVLRPKANVLPAITVLPDRLRLLRISVPLEVIVHWEVETIRCADEDLRARRAVPMPVRAWRLAQADAYTRLQERTIG